MMKIRYSAIAFATILASVSGASQAVSLGGTYTVDGASGTSATENGVVVYGSSQASDVQMVNTQGNLLLVGTKSPENAKVLGQNILLQANGSATAYVNAQNVSDASSLILGDDQTAKIVVESMYASGYGLWARGQGAARLEVNAENLEINSAMGVLAMNRTETALRPENRATVIINAKNTVINADHGILNFSNGYIEVNGNLEVNAKNALYIRGNSDTFINRDGKNTVVLNGNIRYDTPGSKANSGNFIEANLVLRLTDAQSGWTGNVVMGYPSYNADNPAYTTFSDLHIELSNGAQWTPTAIQNNEVARDDYVLYEKYTGIRNLELNDGVININRELIGSDAEQVVIDNLKGTGGTINVEVAKNGDEYSKAGVKVNATDGSSDKPITLTQNYVGVDADTTDDFVALNSVELADSAENVRQVQVIPEGYINGENTRTTEADGTVTERVKTNSKQDAYKSLTAMNVLSWRHDTNDLTKRMGELRTSPEGIGSWVRVYGSKQKYGAQNLVTKSNSIQLGADVDVGAGWKVGAAYSYTDGDTTYDLGSAENKSYSGALYGSWFSESGQFVDLILKYARMSSDFRLNGFSGSQDNNALSVSAEYGRHFKLNDLAFVEPQVELTYGRIYGDDFDADQGVRVDQDNFDTLIGRIGARAGFYFPNNRGSIYARVSGAYDFMGEYEYTASSATVAPTRFKDDLGGAWVEYAVGANLNLSENAYTYIDLERTSGGDVTEQWRWNVGLRYVW